MRKISLDMDALKVESFDTVERSMEKRGTVRGYFTRDWEESCANSCSGPVACICPSVHIECL